MEEYALPERIQEAYGLEPSLYGGVLAAMYYASKEMVCG